MDSTQNQTYFLSQSRYPQGILPSQKPRYHPSALKELLQKPTQQCHNKTSLSPNGTFKYIKRQNAKAYYKSYGGVLKPPIFTSQERIRRPLNCFMVFSHLERRKAAEEHPELHNADLSKILGKRWKTLTPLEKQPYIDEAERIRQLHTEIYPDYKYQPRRKNQKKKTVKKSEDGQESQDEDKSTSNDQFASSEDSPETKNYQLKNPVEDSSLTASKGASMVESSSQDQQHSYQTNLPPKYNPIQNPNYHQLTPAASPYYVTQDTTYNQNLQETHVFQDVADALKSFPPTPEVSPIMMNREDSVFGFDPHCYLSPGLHQQSQQSICIDLQRNIQQSSHQVINPTDLSSTLQQQDQVSYQNYNSANNLDYYNGTVYSNNYNGQQQILHHQYEMQSNLQKTGTTNNFVNILDSLQNH